MPNVNMNSGSNAMLAAAPIITDSIATRAWPCAVMNGFSPSASITLIVPARYMPR